MKISVNGKEIEAKYHIYTFDDLVRLADKDVNGPAPTITYRTPKSAGGTLVRGDLILASEGTVFNVQVTGQG
ncbi:MAG: hypothetical protein A2Y38_06400 [Spirochaetes bacterium GWB1_59_5]|nr:MAG: hypothetical protein A2Y38_06400 [Spirochaetes bacterium GWB1_59_5]